MKWQNPLWLEVFQEFADLAARARLNCIHSIKWDQFNYVDNTTVSQDYFLVRNNNPAQQNGTFPSTNPYLLTAIGIYFPVRPQVSDLGGTVEAAAVETSSNSTGMIDDIINIVNNGTVRMQVEQRPYSNLPFLKLAAGCGFEGLVGIEGDNEKQWGVPTLGGPNNLFQLDVPIIIRAQVDVGITLVWPAAINTTVGNIPVRIYLEGIEARSQVS